MGAGEVLRSAGLSAALALAGCGGLGLRWAPELEPPGGQDRQAWRFQAEGAAPVVTPAPAAPSAAPERWPKWVIYTAAIGAVVVGAGLIWLTTTGDDVQRFEVSSP